ncbi:MAG: hypothetical protein FWD05_13745 [Oscillospiraceae bacterium]|nr:hypothetical protein [Oscillospiraceae bacterium]
MSGIVIELQRDALDSNVDTVALLRKAYLVARKLQLKDFQEWVQNELNGYDRDSNIPSYREVRAELKGLNPMRGWIPVLIPNDEVYEALCKQKLCQSIPEIVSLLNKGSGIIMPLGGSVAVTLSNWVGFATEYRLNIFENTVEAIVETVRNHLLEWSIMLEENNIIGEGLVFSDEEKQQAKQAQIIHYTNNFFGNVDNSQIQQGTTSSEQLKEIAP